MGKFEFFAHRKRGIEPSEIPPSVVKEVLEWVYEQPDEYLFKVEPKPDFIFTPPEHSFLYWLHDALLLTEKEKRSERIT
jgi:formylmethanofuran dehydrogenase subunit E